MGDAGEKREIPMEMLEKDAKRVLDRAMDLDHIKGPRMSLENLRAIAQELGISDESLRTALDEELRRDASSVAATAAVGDAPDQEKGGLGGWWKRARAKWSSRWGLATSIGLPLGLAVGTAIVFAVNAGFYMSGKRWIALACALVTLCAGTIAWRPRSVTLRQSLGLNLAFWAGFAFAMAPLYGNNDMAEGLLLSAICFAGSVAGGALLMGMKAILNNVGPAGTAPPGGSPPRPHDEPAGPGARQTDANFLQLGTLVNQH